jgi:hypothetical protein
VRSAHVLDVSDETRKSRSSRYFKSLLHQLLAIYYSRYKPTASSTNLPSAQILKIPVFATTQNAARLGATCPELGLDKDGEIKTVAHVDKTLFSMMYAPSFSYHYLPHPLTPTPEPPK